jgi:hypothetical protein
MHACAPVVAIDPGVCSQWLAQQKIWLSCKTVLKVGTTKRQYIAQVQKNTSKGSQGKEREVFFFPLRITSEVGALHLLTLIMLLVCCSSANSENLS